MRNLDKYKNPEFARCVMFVLEMECGKDKDGNLKDGYVNDPKDPGGETKFGISKRSYPTLNIKTLSIEQALEIYYRDYWLSYGNGLPFPYNLCMFDTAVNMGGRAARKIDLIAKGNWKKFIEERKNYYLDIISAKPNLRKFKNGWLNRLVELRKFIEIEFTSTFCDSIETSFFVKRKV